ncbi:phage major capsid protein [Bacillus sp. ISL-55]|uniref:phage major capsid protein n=1 Tax=Bacillus sp. ISL-55 TaxID=2819134 RepID=UPI001BEB6F86|nr:phage major capsid protein [Bacillus sp. ISL-55]MBT2693152.1 phage major capsid protein [Bacillus sp. ISL-55]
MNKQEYKTKRDAMLAAADKLIQEGKLNDSESKMQEIKNLDAEWEKAKLDQANANSLENNHKVANLEGQSVNAEGQTVEAIGSNLTGSSTGTFGGMGQMNNTDQTIFFRNELLSAKTPNVNNLSLGKYVKGAITGKWEFAQAEQHEFRALSTATAGVLIPEVLSNQVIDMARNQSILFQSGVPMLPMDSNNMTISRVKSDPQFGFKAEGAETTESVMEFEPVVLKSKTVYGLMSITLEALQSSANLESVVRNSMAESIARTIDYSCLFGDGVDEPKGILTYDDINLQAEAADLTNYDPFVRAVGAVRRANGEPTAWALNATTDEQLNLLKDAEGNPLAIPPVLEKMERMVSNQLPDNEGVNSDESTSVIYDPRALLIGLQSPIRIELSREAEDAYRKGIVYLRIYAMVDIAVLRPKHITKITGLKVTPVA